MNIGHIAIATTFAITGIAVHAVARVWSPRRLFFVELGRTINDADRARARRVMAVNAAVTVVGIGLSFTLTHPIGVVLLSLLVPLLPIAFLLREMVKVARSVEGQSVPTRFAVPLDDPPSVFRFLTPAWQVAHGALLAVSSAVFVWVVDQLPATIPLHWNTQGQIDRWGAPHQLWLFAGIMVFDWLIVWLVAYGVTRERWALPTERAEQYLRLQLRRRRLIVQMVEVIMLGINASLVSFWLGAAIGAMPGQEAALHWGVGMGLVLMTVGTLIPLVWFIRPLTNVQDKLRAVAGSDVLGTRAHGWVLGGLFYFAKDDPAVFVPKRVGIGQTLNLARGGAWLFLLTLTVVPLAIALLATMSP